ncbi:hypothetical protein KP509_25G074000 [Ceratopteris richardii]|uniref:Uncharacterized protein n=1 Tax=Ceratopteris richardii TaxID=49495 RepID=A0A8T2RUE9_CERRI|nr:hypothetical protein KP509_25G074000 [Ceratopteris richardii]
MARDNDNSHLMHIKKLEGAHNFAVWQKQCYNILLQKKQAKPIKVKGVKPENMEQDDWDELNELARSTIELSVSDALFFLTLKVWTLPMLFGLDYRNCMLKRVQLAKYIG